MKIGCFALIDAFHTLDHQLARIQELGFDCADITDNHSGGLLGGDIFDAAVSLDGNPFDVKRLFDRFGLTISSVAAHAHLLDPSSPARYGTNEILKAIKLAGALNIEFVITTEHAGMTEWARNLSYDQRIFTIAEKLYEPLRLADDLGVKLLFEPHGPVSDSIQGIHDVRAALDHHPAFGVCLDTGNSWLGGADPVAMAREFHDVIGHVHWKDLPAEMEASRGQLTGCGFSTIALGEGVIDIAGVYSELRDAGIKHSTLEIAGADNLKNSAAYLAQLEERAAAGAK
ncbi:MAG: sugar phosphate isomerase/epimerase family protein [Planctomycetota bacterium]|jgi:inosose dehydratase